MKNPAQELIEFVHLIDAAKKKIGYNYTLEKFYDEQQDKSYSIFELLHPLVGMKKALSIVDENPEIAGSKKWLEKNSHLWRKITDSKSLYYFVRYSCMTSQNWSKSYRLQMKKILIDFLNQR